MPKAMLRGQAFNALKRLMSGRVVSPQNRRVCIKHMHMRIPTHWNVGGGGLQHQMSLTRSDLALTDHAGPLGLLRFQKRRHGAG
jgi:hypothetical protein